MDTEPKVSVIVPVYMVEEYLPFCIECIINQSYSNLEIILVDDGSKDRCGKICEDYSRKDNRIVVLHKENGGLSDARNAGIKIATGEYITCVDSDDYIASDMIQDLYESIRRTGADIAICGTIKTSVRQVNNKSQFAPAEDIVMTPEQTIELGLYSKGFSLSAWGKLYKKSLFYGVEYPKGKLFEDLFTTYKLILKSHKIVYNEKVGYFYYYRPNSIVASNYTPRHLDCFEGLEQMKADGVFSTPLLKKTYCAAVIEAFSELLEKNPPKNDPSIESLWKQVKKYRICTIFNHKCSLRVRAKAATLLMGRNFSQKIINYYYQKKWKRNQ